MLSSIWNSFQIAILGWFYLGKKTALELRANQQSASNKLSVSQKRDNCDKSRITMLSRIPKSWWDTYWSHGYWVGQWNFQRLLLDAALPQKRCASFSAFKNSFLFGFWTETIWRCCHQFGTRVKLSVVEWFLPLQKKTLELRAKQQSAGNKLSVSMQKTIATRVE